MRGLLFAFFILITFQSWSQEFGSLLGTVVAKGKPAEFLHVALKDTRYGTSTDTLGNFLIKNIPVGNYVILFSGIGYITKQKSISISAGLKRLDVEIAEDVSQLQEVVITGTMKEVTKMNSPISVEVYSPTLFKKNPTPNIFEALSLVNGVQPQINCNVCNTGDIHINGLEGPYTMILIDGMPIVSSLSTVYGLSGIPNSMVKRIEVVKGPASTLYGSEAVGGVINVITKDPATSPLLKTDVFATSVGEYNADISAVLKLKKAQSLFGVNYFNYSLPKDINGDNFTDVTLQKRISVFNKWNFIRPSARTASIAFRYVNENRWGGELQWTPQYRGSDIYYGESITTNRYEVIGNYQFSKIAHLNLDYSYNFHHQDSYYGKVPYFAKQHVGFVQLRWNKQLGAHDLLAGLPFRYIKYDDNTPGTETEEDINKPSVTILPGLFLQDEIKVSGKLTALVGARYDHHNIHGNIFTERVSLKLSPDKNSAIRLTGGSGFRVVNLFTEEHAALTGARQVEIKNDLKPEQSWNVNLNYAKTFIGQNSFINLDGSLFYTYFTNKIIGDFLTDPNKIIFDNLNGFAVSRGLTVNSDIALTNSLKFINGITLMDVYRIEKKGNDEVKIPQIHAPRFSGTFTVSYTIPKAKLAVDLTGRVTGPMYLPVVPNDFRPEKSPWFAILNVQLTKTINSRWEVYAGVKNILNFIPADPLLRPFDPFDKQVAINNPNGYTFDTSYNYATMQSIKAFLGVRITVD